MWVANSQPFEKIFFMEGTNMAFALLGSSVMAAGFIGRIIYTKYLKPVWDEADFQIALSNRLTQ